MTTVAYRDGVMAADTQGEYAGLRRTCQKIHRVEGVIIGCSGSYTDGLTFVDWWRAGHDLDKTPKFKTYHGGDDAPDIHAIVLTAEGVEIWTEHFQKRPVTDEFFAVGSGAMAALAAMHMGAAAEKAVGVAMLVDIYTGGDVQVERLDQVE